MSVFDRIIAIVFIVALAIGLTPMLMALAALITVLMPVIIVALAVLMIVGTLVAD